MIEALERRHFTHSSGLPTTSSHSVSKPLRSRARMQRGSSCTGYRPWILLPIGLVALCMIRLVMPRRQQVQQYHQLIAPRLLLVQAAFRHGARTPLSFMYWPDTPYSNCINQFKGAPFQLVDESGQGGNMSFIDLDMPMMPGNGCRMGQLTPEGFDMAVDLGTWLRQRYIQDIPLLDSQFKESQSWLRTTRIQRAAQTLQGVLTGLWPDLRAPGTAPVLVHASEERLEYEYGHNTTCPAWGDLQKQLLNAIAARDKTDKEANELAKRVADALHLPGGAASVNWVRLFDTIAAMQAHNGTKVPPGVTDELMDQITWQAVRHEAGVLAPQPEDDILPADECPSVVQLTVGPLIWHLMNNLIQTVLQHNLPLPPQMVSILADLPSQQHHKLHKHMYSRRQLGGRDIMLETPATRAVLSAAGGAGGLPSLYMYSGHDSTITPLLAAVGRPETTWPPFTSSFVLELWHRAAPANSRKHMQDGGAHQGLWVRVLYNRQPLDLRTGSDEEDQADQGAMEEGWLPLLSMLKRMHAYSLSPKQHLERCALGKG